MHTPHSTRSRADVLALAFVAFALVALLAPALAATNARSDKDTCLANLQEITIALMNHHDTKGAFPLASTQPLDHSPGIAGEKPSGYGWQALLLPFMEQTPLYNYLGNSKVSNKLTVPPFDPAVTNTLEWTKPPVTIMAVSIAGLVCPSFVGGPTIGDDAPEYAAYVENSRPATTSYHATSGSHFMNVEGLARMVTADSIDKEPYEGNGVIVFPGKVRGKLTIKGIPITQIPAGTSNTLVCAESNERNYAAWIDGQTTWLVSAWPSNPDLPRLQWLKPGREELGWSTEQLKNNQVTPGAQKGIDAKAEPPIYLPEGRWTGKAKRTWGASSNHSEGVGHAFADGRVVMLSRDIDPKVYLHLTTRHGKEVIPLDAIK